jgi:hypothetical protein
MSLGLKQHESNVFTGLGTYTYTIPAGSVYTGNGVLVAPSPGIWNFSIMSTILNPPSSLSIVINQNGTPIATSQAPQSPQQQVTLLATAISCAANDVISFVLTSSATADSLPEAIKSIITLNQIG